MLSVIVEAQGDGERLPGLLALLTSAAVEGLVREVILTGDAPAELFDVLREETGAELAPDLPGALAAAKADLVLALTAAFRPRPGWIEALSLHLKGGGREALLRGEGGGFLTPAPYAPILLRTRAAGLAQPDLKRLRRSVGGQAPRLG